MNPRKFRPKVGEKFFHILIECELRIIKSECIGDDIDEQYFKLGNCFPTRKAAMEKLKAIREVLKSA